MNPTEEASEPATCGCEWCGSELLEELATCPACGEGRGPGFYVLRDGELRHGPDDSFGAAGYLLKAQPQSTAWACRYEGWAIRFYPAGLAGAYEGQG